MLERPPEIVDENVNTVQENPEENDENPACVVADQDKRRARPKAANQRGAIPVYATVTWQP
jgi:hypothetical protein